MRFLTLTAEQHAAVVDTHRRLLLIAPAGSGKTEVLARRIERILAESAGEAFRVLAVTFTVKAAEELKTRIRSTSPEQAWRVDCETVHGFALNTLLRYGLPVGVQADVVVYADDVDRRALLIEYVTSLGVPHATASAVVPRVIAEFDSSRTNRPREPLPATPYEDLGADLPELFSAYSTALEAARGIDFPGMLVKLSELLEVDTWVLANFRRTYRHVVVDEAQDLTRAQAMVLRQLVGEEVDLFAVADDRQAINGFAGGAFENAEWLTSSSRRVIRLADNFRCARSVVTAAERLTAAMQSPPRPVRADGAPEGSIVVKSALSPAQEASDVADWVQGLLARGLDATTIAAGEDQTVEHEDVAVVARTRWLLEPTVRELQSRGVPMALNVDASGFMASSEGRAFFEALALVADEGDRPARRRLLEEIHGMAPDLSMESVASGAEALAMLTKLGIEELSDTIAELRVEPSSITRVEAALRGLSTAAAKTAWKSDAQLLGELWERYESESRLQDRTLKGYLRFVSRAQMARPSDRGVRGLTIHRVKGLEFKAVAIVGVQDGALPDYRARTLAEVDEERRSFYVAMTRAKRALRLSWPEVTEDRYGRVHRQRPSRFVAEAGLP